MGSKFILIIFSPVSAQKVSGHKVSKIDKMGQKVSIQKDAYIYNLYKKGLFPIGFRPYNYGNDIIRKMIMFIIFIWIVLTINFLSYVVNFENFMAGNFLGGHFLGRIHSHHLYYINEEIIKKEFLKTE